MPDIKQEPEFSEISRKNNRRAKAVPSGETLRKTRKSASRSTRQANYEAKAETILKERYAMMSVAAADAQAKERQERLDKLLKYPQSGPGRNVLLRIQGAQIGRPETNEEITVTTHGRYYTRCGKHYIVYHEGMAAGLGDTTTMLIYNENGTASMKRSGDQTMSMDFDPGKRQMASYQTPYGVINMNFYTKRVFFDRNSEGGNLRLNYTISIGLHGPSATQLNVAFRFLTPIPQQNAFDPDAANDAAGRTETELGRIGVD